MRARVSVCARSDARAQVGEMEAVALGGVSRQVHITTPYSLFNRRGAGWTSWKAIDGMHEE